MFTKVIKEDVLYTAQCPRCTIGCSGSKNLPAVTKRKIICFCRYHLEHPKTRTRMDQVSATGAYYPPLGTTGAYYAQNGEIRV